MLALSRMDDVSESRANQQNVLRNDSTEEHS
jgi:hypothetical protein